MSKRSIKWVHINDKPWKYVVTSRGGYVCITSPRGARHAVESEKVAGMTTNNWERAQHKGYGAILPSQVKHYIEANYD